MLYVYFLRCNMQYNPPYLSESDIQCECEIRIIVDHSLDIQTLFSGHPSVIRLMVIITACYHRVKGGLGAGGCWGEEKATCWWRQRRPLHLALTPPLGLRAEASNGCDQGRHCTQSERLVCWCEYMQLFLILYMCILGPFYLSFFDL